MSGKNFTELEVGAWYRLNDGSIGCCYVNDEETKRAYPFRIKGYDFNGDDFDLSFAKDGFYYFDKSDCRFNVRERVANANGDPWPETKPEPRPFKVGDVVKITETRPEDYGKSTKTPLFANMMEHCLGMIGEITEVRDYNSHFVVVDCKGGMWTWLDRDLTLIKAVDEPEAPEAPLGSGSAFQEQPVIQAGQPVYCDEENNAYVMVDGESVKVGKVIGRGMVKIDGEQAPKQDEVTVKRRSEITCESRYWECTALITDSIRVKRVGSDEEADRIYFASDLLDGLITTLSRLRDELRG